MMRQSIQISCDIQDIVEVNRRQREAKDGIRIIELSSLSDIIPYKTAESIRRSLYSRKIEVRQLTNHRSFETWTGVAGFVETCMDVRYIPEDTMPIGVELLIFNNLVAMYHIEPTVMVTVIENQAFADQQKALFDSFWGLANKLELNDDGSTTYGVTIRRKPEEVYDFVANLANWPQFSEFAANFERITDTEYIAHTSQGDVRVLARFDREHLLLDTEVVLPSGETCFIPYRVVSNRDGAELIMTNFRAVSASRQDYEEQLRWMDIELRRAKEILEANGRLGL